MDPVTEEFDDLSDLKPSELEQVSNDKFDVTKKNQSLKKSKNIRRKRSKGKLHDYKENLSQPFEKIGSLKLIDFLKNTFLLVL